MRIDIGAHLGHWPFRKFPWETPAGLLERMSQGGIDRAFVANLNAVFYANSQDGNAELAGWFAADRATRDRLIGQAVLNPSYPGWREDMRQCRDRYGFRGVRLYPQYHGYGFDHPDLAELLALARDSGTPVVFSLRLIDTRGRSWLDVQLDEGGSEQLLIEKVAGVLTRFSGLRAVVLQTNYVNPTPEIDATLRNADVLFDTSRASGCGVVGPNSYNFSASVEKFGAEKFAFGSMSPFTDSVSPLVRMEMNDLPETVRNAIWGTNAQRFFRL